MKNITIQVTNDRNTILSIIALKEGVTHQELVQAQMDYYCDCVVDKFIYAHAELNDAESIILSEKITTEKKKIIAARTPA